MGVRSMATYIETKDCKIFIDPGVNLAEKRYGLPPHPLEISEKERVWKEIVRYAEKAEIIIITHYHYDHYNPFQDLFIFENKYVFLKHPTRKINQSQMNRARQFLEKIKKISAEIYYADNREFFIEETRILFSPPVPHGKSSNLGYVLEVLIEEEAEKFLFTSDVQGPILNEHLHFIIRNKPSLIFLDGPVTYLLGQTFSHDDLDKSIENIKRILNETPVRKVIIDHHLLRDIRWRQLILKDISHEEKEYILTAADFSGKPIKLLEANRRRLWEEYPE